MECSDERELRRDEAAEVFRRAAEGRQKRAARWAGIGYVFGESLSEDMLTSWTSIEMVLLVVSGSRSSKRGGSDCWRMLANRLQWMLAGKALYTNEGRNELNRERPRFARSGVLLTVCGKCLM